MSFWYEKEAKRLFQELPFYNVLIEKPFINRLKNINLLNDFPFFDELSISKILEAFKRYAKSYKVEILDLKDALAQLEVSKSSNEDLFKDLLDEIKGFKYQITVNLLLSKHKENRDIDFVLVCFNSTDKTVINLEYDVVKSFQEILYRINNWINKGSYWAIESADAEYVNISIYSPL